MYSENPYLKKNTYIFYILWYINLGENFASNIGIYLEL